MSARRETAALYRSVQQVVDGHLADVITNSWGNGGGNYSTRPARGAFDNIFLIANRVEPDISVDGDPSTGMLVGETQTFPDGTYYDEYRIGGTSLSSPLLAGVMADADQAAGAPLGFVNPLLYKLYASPGGPAAYYDVVPGGKQANVRNDFLDEVDAKEGILTSARVLGYEGRETFCSGTGNCTHQKVALNAAPGFDSMTGLGTPTGGLPAALAAMP